jgi:hypothetical protein
MMTKADAIFKLYPDITNIRDGEAFDDFGNQIEYDESIVQKYINNTSYQFKRLVEYPPFTEYLDGIVKGDQAQINKYISDCQAVKAKYPKP